MNTEIIVIKKEDVETKTRPGCFGWMQVKRMRTSSTSALVHHPVDRRFLGKKRTG